MRAPRPARSRGRCSPAPARLRRRGDGRADGRRQGRAVLREARAGEAEGAHRCGSAGGAARSARATPLSALAGTRLHARASATTASCAPLGRATRARCTCADRRRTAARGADGWVYKVGRRAGTRGRGRPAGPVRDAAKLRGAQRVLWFWCVQAAARPASARSRSPRPRDGRRRARCCASRCAATTTTGAACRSAGRDGPARLGDGASPDANGVAHGGCARRAGAARLTAEHAGHGAVVPADGARSAVRRALVLRSSSALALARLRPRRRRRAADGRRRRHGHARLRHARGRRTTSARPDPGRRDRDAPLQRNFDVETRYGGGFVQ